jgi:hypothetical protein
METEQENKRDKPFAAMGDFPDAKVALQQPSGQSQSQGGSPKVQRASLVVHSLKSASNRVTPP